MPQIIINIPTPEATQRVATAFLALFQYQGPDTPADKAEFVRQRIIGLIKDKVRQYEIRLAQDQAADQTPPEVT